MNRREVVVRSARKPARERDLSRSLSRGFLVSLLLFPTGCFFFGTEPDVCFDVEDPEACRAALGDEDSGSSGGTSRVDGDGDTGGQPNQGSGGSSEEMNSGGSASGGGGDVSSGGSGGEDASVGGQSSGGGTGGAGGSSAPEPLRLNEIYHTDRAYVELFNGGVDVVSLDGIGIATAPQGQTTPDLATVCDLSALLNLEVGAVVLAQRGATCEDSAECMTSCSFVIGAGATVYLLRRVDSSWSIAVEKEYPSPTPVGGVSLQAQPNGTTNFVEGVVSPGELNGP
jgi:hypothetical protein